MTNSNKKVRSFWVLFSLIMSLNGIGFVYIGSKTSNKKWFIEGVIYEIPWIIAFILIGFSSDSIASSFFVLIAFIGMLVSLVRSLWVRKEYKRKVQYGNYNNVKKTALTYVGAIFCLIPLLNGLPFIYLGLKHRDTRFIVGGLICEIIWFLIGSVKWLTGIAMSFLIVSFMLFIKIHYESPQKVYEHIPHTPKEIKPKKEKVKPTTTYNNTPKNNPENNYFKDYEIQLNNLKQTYNKKESRIKEFINNKFNASEITHSRFLNIIDNSHANFYNQYDSAMKLISLSTSREVKIEEKLQKRVETLKMINDKMEELEIELIINDNDEKKTDADFNELMENMGDLIDSVKDYD